MSKDAQAELLASNLYREIVEFLDKNIERTFPCNTIIAAKAMNISSEMFIRRGRRSFGREGPILITFEFGRIQVNPTGRGVFSTLLDKVEADAPGCDAIYIELVYPPQLQDYLRKRGYTEIGYSTVGEEDPRSYYRIIKQRSRKMRTYDPRNGGHKNIVDNCRRDLHMMITVGYRSDEIYAAFEELYGVELVNETYEEAFADILKQNREDEDKK